MITPPTIPLKRLPQPDQAHLRSTWRAARPGRIAAALRRAEQRDPGGWYVAGAASDIGPTSKIRRVAGREVAFWRGSDGGLHAGPGACPHLGAALADCEVVGDDLLCRWHGMALPAEGGGAWREYPALDDGVLVWVRLPAAGETPAPEPVIGPRPPLAESIAAVVSVPGVCEPRDVIANRLDPWHGAWFHPYAFSHLTVDEVRSDADALVVDVAFRLNHTWGVPVTARFTTPDARTIVMDIIEGEGAGSVVETHATPLFIDELGRQHTMVTEATIAHSPRTGFRVARSLSRLLQPAIRHTARQLWVDDLLYAERLYEVRRTS